MFSLYFYQFNKSSSDLIKKKSFYFLKFLESVPNFMEMGFEN